MELNYTPPVSRLLAYGGPDAVKPADWPDYVGELGFTTAHVPELLQLMQDTALAFIDPDEPPPLPDYADAELVWCAPIHAWRALAQLKALEMFDYAMDLAQSDIEEWAREEFVDIIQRWGAAVIEPVVQLIEDALANDKALFLINGLYKLPEHYPETRDRVITELTRLLETYPKNHKDSNSFLVLGLLELKATESADLIEKVYASERIDDFVPGTWARAQIDLGLKAESDFTEEELTPEMPPGLKQMREMYEAMERQRKPDAFAVGLPMDSSKFASTKPPGFDDMLGGQKSAAPKAEKGFGPSSGKTQKRKKGKKKR